MAIEIVFPDVDAYIREEGRRYQQMSVEQRLDETLRLSAAAHLAIQESPFREQFEQENLKSEAAWREAHMEVFRQYLKKAQPNTETTAK